VSQRRLTRTRQPSPCKLQVASCKVQVGVKVAAQALVDEGASMRATRATVDAQRATPLGRLHSCAARKVRCYPRLEQQQQQYLRPLAPSNKTARRSAALVLVSCFVAGGGGAAAAAAVGVSALFVLYYCPLERVIRHPSPVIATRLSYHYPPFPSPAAAAVCACVTDSASASASAGAGAVTAHRLLLPDLRRLLTCSRTPAAHRAGYL
jgi:hypothetical protein